MAQFDSSCCFGYADHPVLVRLEKLLPGTGDQEPGLRKVQLQLQLSSCTEFRLVDSLSGHSTPPCILCTRYMASLK
jgi:hypothetical protein